jgi:Ca2+-binding EF-hand superfamily protein
MLEVELLFFEPAAAQFPEFDRQDVKGFIKAFRQFDKDGSLSIDASELQDMMRFLGIGSSVEDAKALIAKVDLDESGEIEWEEFLLVSPKEPSNNNKKKTKQELPEYFFLAF